MEYIKTDDWSDVRKYTQDGWVLVFVVQGYSVNSYSSYRPEFIMSRSSIVEEGIEE